MNVQCLYQGKQQTIERRSNTPGIESSIREDISFSICSFCRGRRSAAKGSRKVFIIYVRAEAWRKGRKDTNCCFPTHAEAKTNFNPISQSAEATRKRFPIENIAEGTCHAAEAPWKPSRKGFDTSLRPQLGLEHCSIAIFSRAWCTSRKGNVKWPQLRCRYVQPQVLRPIRRAMLSRELGARSNPPVPKISLQKKLVEPKHSQVPEA